MKRDLTVLSVDIRNRIVKWNKLPDHMRGVTCPFDQQFHSCKICKRIFPGIGTNHFRKNTSASYRCPCVQYGTKYVSRVVDKILQKEVTNET